MRGPRPSRLMMSQQGQGCVGSGRPWWFEPAVRDTCATTCSARGGWEGRAGEVVDALISWATVLCWVSEALVSRFEPLLVDHLQRQGRVGGWAGALSSQARPPQG